MKKQKITELLISIAIAELVGVLSGLLAGNSAEFYSGLVKPPLSPPGWLFPVVWPILYALMGISAYLIYASDADGQKKKKALTLYGAQLFVNFMWSIVFFRFQWIGASVVIIILLLVLVIWMTAVFYKIRPSATWINFPYILWLLFAAYLNIGVFVLN
ncbi:MAG: TspO/MBR family protein [Oscillospiraceae bacterium]